MNGFNGGSNASEIMRTITMTNKECIIYNPIFLKGISLVIWILNILDINIKATPIFKILSDTESMAIESGELKIVTVKYPNPHAASAMYICNFE